MRIIAIIARYLLGLLFTLFGLNGFLHFLHPQPPHSALAMQFLTVMSVSHYVIPVFAFQLAGGLLLLSGRFVPLALTFLAPVLVNILTYHITMDPGGIGPAVVATILWILVFVRYRANFQGLFESGARSTTA